MVGFREEMSGTAVRIMSFSDSESIDAAVSALRRGELIGMPTETVYGLAGDASDPHAVARIFAAKGRPSFNPLISHVASLELAAVEGVLDDRASMLAERFWPGPLTLVVPFSDIGRTSELARAGLTTIGLRVPAHPVAHALLEAFAGPLSAPSANPSGKLSPTRRQDVQRELGEFVSMVLDGGDCEKGIESSVVSLLPGEPPRLLRPGAIPRAELESVVGALRAPGSEKPRSPGQLVSHYAPRAALRLNAAQRRDGEQLLGFGESVTGATLNLSPTGDTVEAAANLYRMLRELDASGVGTIAVSPIPKTGLGEAINDRLARAAAPRGRD